VDDITGGFLYRIVNPCREERGALEGMTDGFSGYLSICMVIFSIFTPAVLLLQEYEGFDLNSL
jgi:hypothetical protein